VTARFQTPRTTLTWSTPEEWLACAWQINGRRHSYLLHQQARLHVEALPVAIVYQCSRRQTLTDCDDLLRYGLFRQPLRGQRLRAPHTALIVAIANRIFQIERAEDQASMEIGHNSAAFT
jgi:hypothetical protein